MNEAVLKVSLIIAKTIPGPFSFHVVQLLQFLQPWGAQILTLHCLLQHVAPFSGLTNADSAAIFLLPTGITPLQHP